jgi:hypothetical protein
LVDEAYDYHEYFIFFNEKRIQPTIRVKKEIQSSLQGTAWLGIKKLSIKQKISLNGKRKEDMDKGGWLKQYFHQSNECLANIHMPPTFKNRVKEMVMKESLYNLFTRLA